MTSAPIVYQNNEQDRLLHLFIFVDEALKMIPSKKKQKRTGRRARLTEAELITLALWRFHLKFHDWKHAYLCYLTHYSKEFPNLPSYKSFIQGINRVSVKALWILALLMKIARKDNTLLKMIDSSSLPVCKNTRRASHRVMKAWATSSKTSQGWFYGMKLHLIVDSLGNLLSTRITTGEVDDRKPVISMLKGILGTLLADVGYVKADLKYKLFKLGKDFVTCVRKNMKQLMSKSQHQLLKKRQWVEICLSNLKDRLKIATSLPRSVTGVFAHYIYTLLAYQTFKVLSF